MLRHVTRKNSENILDSFFSPQSGIAMSSFRRRDNSGEGRHDRRRSSPSRPGLSQSAFHQKFHENYMRRLTGDRSNDLYQSAFPIKHIPEHLNFSYRLLGRNIFTKSPPKVHDSDDEKGRGGRRSTRAEKRYKNYLRFQAQQGTLGQDPIVNKQQQQQQLKDDSQSTTGGRDEHRRKRRKRSLSSKRRKRRRRKKSSSSSCSTCSSTESCEECRKSKKKRVIVKKRRRTKRVQSKDEEDDDVLGDSKIKLKPIWSFIDDREKMLEEMLKSVGQRRLDAMMPDILRQRDMEDVRVRCIDQLECMSKKRIRCILDGKEMLSSSGTDDDDEKVAGEERAFVPVRTKTLPIADQQPFDESELRRSTLMDIRIKTTSLSGLAGFSDVLPERKTEGILNDEEVNHETTAVYKPKKKKRLRKLSPGWSSALESPEIRPNIQLGGGGADVLWSSADDKASESDAEKGGSISTTDLLDEADEQQQEKKKVNRRRPDSVLRLTTPIVNKWNQKNNSETSDSSSGLEDSSITLMDRICGSFG
ncbi:hypothetical protein ACOME3_009909 [Neoechinorhynchus agilis]